MFRKTNQLNRNSNSAIGTAPSRIGLANLTDKISLQIEAGHGKKAIVIFVPVPLLQGFHKVQQRYDTHSVP